MRTCLVIALVLSPLGARAVSPAENAPQQGVAPSAIETQLDPAFIIGKQLRCPVCQGMPIAESPSQMAQDMMLRVREMVAEGKDEKTILDSFVASYGEWVLLKPRAEGFNILVWVGPPLGLLIGLLLVWRAVRRGPKEPKGSAPAPLASASSDPYLNAIHKEVEQ
jgi:cytochrome c-type biogenesis protein CcmH